MPATHRACRKFETVNRVASGTCDTTGGRSEFLGTDFSKGLRINGSRSPKEWRRGESNVESPPRVDPLKTQKTRFSQGLRRARVDHLRLFETIEDRISRVLVGYSIPRLIL